MDELAVLRATAEAVAETCELHFMDADGYCVQTLRGAYATTVEGKDAELAKRLAGLKASLDLKGQTIIHTDDPVNPHVCKVHPLTPYDLKVARLDALRAKGWESLTADEQTEATALKFDLGL